MGAVALAESGGPAPPVIGPDGEIWGSEVPRIWTPPLRPLTPETSLGFECIAFAENVVGMTLLPWQKWWLIHALELNPDGSYRFKQVFLLVARQNGKTTVVKALILWKMFLDEARLILGGAQTLTDAEDCWEAVLYQAMDVPALAKRLDKPFWTSGKRRLQLLPDKDYMTRCQYRVVPLKKDAGRGKTCDFLFLDELREHQTWDGWDALESTTLRPPRAQIVAASNAGDARSVVLNAKREAAMTEIANNATDESAIGWFEYSAPDNCELDDEQAIAQANPSYRYTLAPPALKAARSKPEASYRTENLCQVVRSLTPGVIPKAMWEANADSDSEIVDGAPVFCAVDVSWNRAYASVAVAGRRADGKVHVEIVAHRAGTEWIAPWLRHRREHPDYQWFTNQVVIQGKGAPVSSLAETFQENGLSVIDWSGTELGKSFGNFYDAIRQRAIRHRSQQVLDLAIEVAQEKRLGDASFIDRRNEHVDVSPAVAAQAAYWYATKPMQKPRPSIYEQDGVTALFTGGE